MSSTAAAPREYVCPGEGYAIPRPVHLARMAAGFAKCRVCPLRDDAASRPADARVPASPFRRLFQTDGIRGVYRNEFDAATAERLAAALAAMLWEDAPALANGFPVVVGYDDRPWSLPLAVAVGGALRRSGCETIEIGLATGPAFRCAVAHLDAAAGVLATGGGGGPAVAGLDFALAGGHAVSFGGGLDRIAAMAERPAGRMTRRGGGRRTFHVVPPYEAGLRRHLLTITAVTVVVGTASSLVLARLERLFADLPAKLHLIPLPRRDRDGGIDSARFSDTVREAKAAFGLWIDEDGTACRAIDETGRAIAVADLAGLLLADALAERPDSAVALDWPLAETLCGATLHNEVIRSNGTAEAMAVSVRDHAPAVGADSAGRFWLPGSPPAADALVTLARLLRLVGEGEEPFSRRVATARRA